MEVENYSPFPHMAIQKFGYKNQLFDVIIVVGTFDLVHGQPLYISEDQLPINTSDKYTGPPEISALTEETHLVISKKNTDIIVIGNAKSKNNEPSHQWDVGVRVGNYAKIAQVHASRAWTYGTFSGWQIEYINKSISVPLDMSVAYGGYQKKDGTTTNEGDDINDKNNFETCPQNPAGLGFIGKQKPDTSKIYKTAQIQDPFNPITDIKKTYAPISFGPLARWNPLRTRYLGTRDQNWKNTRFPYPPDDFDFLFYQAAQPDLICKGYLNGDEPIVLVGCNEKGRIDSSLPGLRLLSILTDKDGLSQPEPMRLDTVSINVDTNQVQLVWRRTVPKSWELKHVLLAAIPNGPDQATKVHPIHIHPRNSSKVPG